MKKNRSRGAKSGTEYTNTIVGSKLAPSRIISFVPEMLHAKHKYVEGFILTGSATGVLGTEYVYALNGLYDPYLSAGGHQAYGFDQLSPWYETYTVTDCHVSITAVTPNTESVFLGLGWRPTGGSLTIAGLGVTDIGEKDTSRWFPVPKYASRASDVAIDVGNFNIAQLDSRSNKEILAERNYSGTASANPASVPVILFALGDLGGAAYSTINFVVTLTYSAVWRGRKAVAQS